MWNWLHRVLERVTPRPQLPPAPQPIRSDPPVLRVISGGLDTTSSFEQLLALTSQTEPPPVPLTPEEHDREDLLSERVLAHFRKNRPAPSALPAISLQVLNLVAEPDLSLSQLTRVVSQDPAFSAAILKVANSPAYMGVQETQTLRDAVARLGLTEVGRVAGMVSARSLFQPQVRSEFAVFGSRWNDIFAESVAAARGAAWLCMRVKRARSDHAFLAGILHDLGRSVALRSVAALAMTEHCFELEGTEIDRVVERVHVEIGGELHADWSLPRFCTLVAMRHHELNLPADGEYVDVHCVRLASALVQYLRQPWRVTQVKQEIDQSCLALHLDGFALRSLETQLRTELESVLASFHQPARKRTGSNF
ncbi:MAG: HDOD domain-containing protein [Archangium sp.]|nr:HDOD domain-containing protein [Archangium sp.]MDP3156106.1 HDOD domain-containing protein [Archangium sp.]MDP3571443.1 HDOD domain-containing protein [Archangium sp.]